MSAEQNAPSGRGLVTPLAVPADSRLKSLARVSGGALLGVASAAGSAFASYVSATRGPVDGSPLAALSSAEVLRVANTLSALLQQGPADEFRMPELPQMVVVGTQSSGKSSLLNAIMACDLLPLGEAMVTRCPLHLQLAHAPSEAAGAMRAEFGTYEGGAWQAQRTFALAAPNPSSAEIAQVRREIEAQTCALAGPGKCISSRPIHLRIHSAYVPDLTLIDLPGLTQMALTEQGQPADIKQQIRSLVLEHVQKPRAVILAVLPARTDLEADAALELVKEVDPHGERTIGVLTKVDLMNPVRAAESRRASRAKPRAAPRPSPRRALSPCSLPPASLRARPRLRAQGSDVAAFLADDGRVPSDLRMGHGYYAVRNRSTGEVVREGMTVEGGFEREAAFFAAHPAYGALRPAPRARLGVPALARAMSRLLVSAVHAHLPAILAELREAHARTQREALELGAPLPADDASRLALAQSIVAEFCRDFTGCLSEKRAGVRTGRRIKDAFCRLRERVHGSEAVSKEAFPDEYIAGAVKDCEGNHLSFPVPPIEVLEQLLLAPAKAPIRQLLPPCVAAADEVRAELRELSESLCAAPALLRFPRLRAHLREDVGALLGGAHAQTVAKLGELVEMEEAYIATEDAAFLQVGAFPVPGRGRRRVAGGRAAAVPEADPRAAPRASPAHPRAPSAAAPARRARRS